MRKEKRSEIIHDALGMLDDDMIEEVDRLRGHVAETLAERNNDISSAEDSQYRKKAWRKPIHWRRWTTLAASICLLIIGSWAWEFYSNSAKEESDCMHGTEAESENDMDNVVQEGMPLDSMDSEMEDALEPEIEGTHYPDDSTQIEEGENEFNALGDEYHLLNNYVKVSILPAKAWQDNGNYLAQAVAIKEEYRPELDKLVENMCDASSVKTEELEESDMDMVYHIFFERSDGEIIHCWLLEDGYLYYDDLQEVSLKLDREVYATIFKIFAMHW